MPAPFADDADRVRSLGRDILAALPGSREIYLDRQEREPYADVEVTRDAAYGPHERHRLDVFRTAEAASPKPIFVFVHGGGFVGGDKRHPGSPYNDNVALWAARNGMIGINITYRLAPEFTYPAGSEDLASAAEWVRENASTFGGDPGRIFVMGTSAGAVHVANFLAQPMFAAARDGVAGGIMLSGVYVFAGAPAPHAYMGPDDSVFAERSSLPGLLESPIPLLFGIAEFEPMMFEQQAGLVIQAWTVRHGRWPNLVRLMGHNHLTATLHLNTDDDDLGRQMQIFMSRC